jgi:hypothetical protein
MNKLVEKTIIKNLSHGAVEKSKLIIAVTESRDVTVQAVYRTLRELAGLDVLTIHKNSVSLTIMYIETELQRWGQIAEAYNTRPLSDHFLGLREGEMMELRFNTLNELDTYWVHAFLLLERRLLTSLPTYSIIPHDWFYYGRREADIFWTEKQRHKQRLIITHPSAVDMCALRARRKAGYEMTAGVNPFKQEENEYYTLVDDWILKVTLDARLHEQLVEISENAAQLSDIDQIRLQGVLIRKGSNSMKIYRRRKRAYTMTSKVKKYFE